MANLTVKLENNVLTVVTPITKEMAQKAVSDLVSYDDKKNETCRVQMDNQGGDGSISKYGLTCNAIVDDKLAVVMVLPQDATMETVKRRFGKSLVNVENHIADIVSGVQAERAAVDQIFA